MKFCSNCGARLPEEKEIPPGDNLPRHICGSCGTIHYQNPRIIVGCIPVWEHRILMCRRAIEPRKGFWTIPAGFMENQETLEVGAQRECMEEANAEVDIGAVHTVYSIPHINQVYIIFLSKLKNLDFSPGPESLETVLMEASEIPWDEIAFSSIKFTLHNYFHGSEDSGRAYIGSYDNDIPPRPKPGEK